MKKVLISLTAAAMAVTGLSAPAMAASHRHPENHGKYVSAAAHRQHAWRKGERFDRRYATNYRVVSYRDYGRRLYAPPSGYHWVRDGNDALLIGVTSGIVASVVAGLFN